MTIEFYFDIAGLAKVAAASIDDVAGQAARNTLPPVPGVYSNLVDLLPLAPARRSSAEAAC